MKSVLLIGLGRFGRHMAEKPRDLRHEVLAVDRNEQRVNEILPLVTNAQIGDSTSEQFIASLGVQNFDLCVVAIGADGIGVVTPVFYKLSDQGLVDFYEAVAEKCPNMVGIKYSWPDFAKLQQFMPIRDGTFSTLVGPDHLFEALCAVGGEGVVSGNAMCIPEHYARIWKAIQAKGFDLATKYQWRTNVLNAIMCEINNIAAYKVILKAEGVIATTKMRRPMENLPPEQEEKLLETMRALKYREVPI